MACRVFEFGGFKVDCDRFELSRAGRTLKLERKPMELLILLAAGNGHLITRTEIVESLWDSEVFVDTEHGINTAIRKIRQVLGDDPENPSFVQTVTGKGYRFIAPIGTVEHSLSGDQNRLSPTEANPLEVGGAAAAPMPTTASPTQPPTVLNASQPSDMALGNARNSRLILWLAAFGVAVVLAFIAISPAGRGLAARFLGLSARPEIRSLAVLPLDNLSGDPSQDYFADGMTDELITMLAKNSTLRVVSRTSVMQYKGVRRPLPEIARALGVDGILEGSIARSGEKVHMTVQLIQAPSDTHLWAESYDRSSNDVAALPGEAARDVANRLHNSLASTTPARYINPAAHDAYLQGRYLWWEGHNDASFPYFKKATELQPDYALAWFGLSSYYGAGAMFGQLDPRPALPQEDFTAQKCLQLDPSASECHLAMAGDELLSKWNVEEALRETSRAIELDPRSADAYELRSRILQVLNRQEESIQAQKTALEFNPADPWTLALALWIARRYDAALTDVQQRVVATPHDPILQLFLAMNYRGKGMDKESIRCLEKYYLYAEGPATADALHRAFERGGAKAAVEWQIKFVKARAAKRYVSPVDLAELYAQLGDREQTLALFEEAFRQHAPGLLWIQCDSAYDFLHSDERYRSIIKRVGLPPAY
ncbi:MAG: winged helix-turn-helix domain-containing protein [Terracidiphilus sp.]